MANNEISKLGQLLLDAYAAAVTNYKPTDYRVTELAALIIRSEGRAGRLAVMEIRRGRTDMRKAAAGEQKLDQVKRTIESLSFGKKKEEAEEQPQGKPMIVQTVSKTGETEKAADQQPLKEPIKQSGEGKPIEDTGGNPAAEVEPERAEFTAERGLHFISGMTPKAAAEAFSYEELAQMAEAVNIKLPKKKPSPTTLAGAIIRKFKND